VNEALLPIQQFLAQRSDVLCAVAFGSVAAGKDLGAPELAGAEFDLLAQRAVIEPSLARQMREAVGMRNLLVHEYAEADWSMVHAAALDLSRLRSFLDAILRFYRLD